MTLRIDSTIDVTARNAGCDSYVGNADAGSVEFYTGSPPANVGDATGETLLVSITLPNPAFGAASSGSATLNGTPHTNTAVADGTIGWARINDSGGSAIWDENDVGTSGNAITVSDTSVVTGQDIEITSYTFSVSLS